MDAAKHAPLGHEQITLRIEGQSVRGVEHSGPPFGRFRLVGADFFRHLIGSQIGHHLILFVENGDAALEFPDGQEDTVRGCAVHLEGAVVPAGRPELRTVRIVAVKTQRVEHDVPGNYAIKVDDGEVVEEGRLLASRKGEADILARTSGRVSLEDGRLVVIHEDSEERAYEIPVVARLAVVDGMTIRPVR